MARTLPGKLVYGRANKREAAVLSNFTVQVARITLTSGAVTETDTLPEGSVLLSAISLGAGVTCDSVDLGTVSTGALTGNDESAATSFEESTAAAELEVTTPAGTGTILVRFIGPVAV